MNFLYGSIMFLVGLMAIVAFLPVYNEVISIIPYSGVVIMMCGVMVLLLVVGLVYRLYADTVFTGTGGGGFQ